MAKSDRVNSRTIFVCQQCGREELKWLGRCPNCREWNSFLETTVAPATPSRSSSPLNPPQELSQVAIEVTDRLALPLAEFNRVLGGGLVAGSLMLTGGDPGIGKSTLLLQVSALVAQTRGKVVYVSGEETLHQIKLRAERLGIKGEQLYLLAETDLEVILNQIEELSPSLVVIDSIQAVYLPELGTAPGSITQVRECTMRLMHWAKLSGVPVFIVGHVTKDGAIAGPRTLEHIVDMVLYLEGEPFSTYRLLRCVKNRFGSTNEIGVFEMKEQGLVEVDNPSQAFLSQRWGEAIGSAVVPVLEGSRPLLVEIQALTNPTSFGLPRRTANGVDFNRLLLITAVLSKRVGLKLGNQDIMVNVTGGFKIGEPAADLGIALAISSSFRDVAVDPQLVAIGELGLSSELRAVTQLERRVNEAARLGFQRCLVPKVGAQISPAPKNIQLIPVSSLREAMRIGLLRGKAGKETEQNPSDSTKKKR
ncbi:DNA repair protein RadA [Chloroflexota bacterium]